MTPEMRVIGRNELKKAQKLSKSGKSDRNGVLEEEPGEKWRKFSVNVGDALHFPKCLPLFAGSKICSKPLF